MAIYENGRIPDTVLRAVPGGGRLTDAAAQAWSGMRAEVGRRFGWTPEPTGPLDTFRPYSGNFFAQLETFERRYTRTHLPGRPTKVWNGVTFWLLPKEATAAVPGTSNHGWACAVDVDSIGAFTGSRYQQFAAVAAEFGWTNDEGREVDEPWHWVDVANARLVAGGTPGVSRARTATEEDDMPLNQADLEAIDRLITGRIGTLESIDRLISARLDERLGAGVSVSQPGLEAVHRLVAGVLDQRTARPLFVRRHDDGFIVADTGTGYRPLTLPAWQVFEAAGFAIRLDIPTAQFDLVVGALGGLES